MISLPQRDPIPISCFTLICAAVLFWLPGSAASETPPVTDPATWEIRQEHLFSPSSKRPADAYIGDLFTRLAAQDGVGKPVSRDEFLALLQRPESREVYAAQLIKVATPQSVQIQDQAHYDGLKIFMSEKRQKAGVAFLRTHEALLKEAEARYGVARKDIVSILMWESGLGEFTGKLRVFNVLMGQLLFLEIAQEQAIKELASTGMSGSVTSAEVVERQQQRFDRIKKRCVENLVALLRQSKAMGADPLEQRGSWGGAIGYPQFMPASMAYAVDGDQDGVVNLHDWPDAIMSVGNYLKVRGKYGASDRARRTAILRYNPLDSYVNGVITYAEAVWARYKKGE